MRRFESIRHLFGRKSVQSSYKNQSVTIGGKDYTTREIHTDDIKDLLAIEREVYAGELPWTRSAFLSELHSKSPHLYILIRKAEKTIGFIGCRVMSKDGHITNVAVAKEEQGQGLGSFLINEAISFSRAQRCERMSLEVRLSNKHAQSIYRKIGFSSNRIVSGYYDDGEDALEMILDLKEG